ncbi:hypothetical protein D3C76_1583500 [compost metagenome]
MRLSIADQIQNVRYALGQLVNRSDMNALFDQCRCRSFCSDDLVTQVIEAAQQLYRLLFILIRNRSDDGARCRDFHACTDQAFI